MDKKGYTYIVTNKKNGTLYTGVTSDIVIRALQHKHHTYDWFTAKYNLHILVRFQEFPNISEAIAREKKIKWRTRKKKLDLIEINNPERVDLANTI